MTITRVVHRIVRALATEGLPVPEDTVCGALESAIAGRNAHAGGVHADETSWRVFEPTEGKDGYRWWLWAFWAQDTVVFTMEPTRSTAVLQRHFGIDRTDPALPQGQRLVGSQSADTSSGPQTRTCSCGSGGIRGWRGHPRPGIRRPGTPP